MPGAYDAGIQSGSPPSYFGRGQRARWRDRRRPRLARHRAVAAGTFATGHPARPMTIHIRLGRVSRRARIAAPQPPVRQILEATGLTDVFSVYPALCGARREGHPRPVPADQVISRQAAMVVAVPLA